MKKTLLLILATIVISTTAQAEVNFQKVYELPGMTSTQIKEAYGDPTIDIGMDTMAKLSDVLNTQQGLGWKTGLEQAKTGKLRCDISIFK